MQRPAEERRMSPFSIPKLRMPDYGLLPTQIPQSRAAEQAKAVVGAAIDAAQQATDGQTPRVVHPAPTALPGMRTPFAVPTQTFGEVSPTFLPQETESIWDRLFKNIVQGVISAIGWHVYSLARMVDFFA
jgi:hypothetical protein